MSRDEGLTYYLTWLRRQWRAGADNPARRELVRLTGIYRDTGILRLGYWCRPLSCHVDIVAVAIDKLLTRPDTR